MSGLGWKLRRLRAMSASEIAQRGRAAIRDSLFPPAYSRCDAATAAARWIAEAPAVAAREVWRKVARVPDAAQCAGTLESARCLASGRWTLFGNEVTLDDPPDWHRDPSSGEIWPDRPGRDIDYRTPGVAVAAVVEGAPILVLRRGPKLTWELGRLTMLPTLALATRLTGEADHAARARRWLDDFVRRNPLGRGIHHASGIEMAIRVITMGWTLALLEDAAAADTAAARGLIAQQALWCRDHLSLGSSANNHLLAEYAAMAVAGAGLGLAGGERLMAEGLRGIEQEVPRQIHVDGVTAEQAFRYLPFVWELLLPALVIAEARGWRAPDPLRERLAASLEFARTARRADGTLPPIGDDDDARVLLADERGSRLDLAGNALAAWLGAPALSRDAQALAVLIGGRSAPEPREASDGEHVFESGGYTVWRRAGAIATFDHGTLGLGAIAAHGHADALAVTLRLGDDDLIGDPGTLAYFADEAARTLTRSTSAHSTVSFGGRSQSEMLGPFLWGRRARVARERDGARCDWWSGEHHVRRVRFEAGALILGDEAVGPAPELVFALAPGADVRLDGRRAEVTIGRSMARFELAGCEDWRVEEGAWAPRFMRRESAPRLVARMPEARCRTVVKFGRK